MTDNCINFPRLCMRVGCFNNSWLIGGDDPYATKLVGVLDSTFVTSQACASWCQSVFPIADLKNPVRPEDGEKTRCTNKVGYEHTSNTRIQRAIIIFAFVISKIPDRIQRTLCINDSGE